MRNYTKADLEELVSCQLENLNAMHDLLSIMKVQNELLHNANKKLKDEISEFKESYPNEIKYGVGLFDKKMMREHKDDWEQLVESKYIIVNKNGLKDMFKQLDENLAFKYEQSLEISKSGDGEQIADESEVDRRITFNACVEIKYLSDTE